MEGFLGILLFRFLVKVAAPQLAGLGLDFAPRTSASAEGIRAAAKEGSHV